MIQVDGKSFSVHEVMNVENKPSMFFKYHSINENLTKLLKQSQFHMQSHLRQKDFMDCKFDLAPEYLENMMREEALKVLQERGQLHLKDHALKEIMNQKSWRGIHLLDTYVRSPIYLTCFTTNANAEHMWTLYGNGHKGLRLGFDFSNDKDLYDHILPVRYTEQVPVVYDDESLAAIPYFKRRFFHVEDEWRICVSHPSGLPFKKSSLKNVTFGCRVPERDQENVINELMNLGYDLDRIEFNQIQVNISGNDVPFHLMDALINLMEEEINGNNKGVAV
jgi:hypothetical protein